MKNNLKILFLGLLIFFFFLFPRPASADFLGIVDLMNASLEGVEEFAGPIAEYAIKFFFLYVIGLILLSLSGSILQHVIVHQAEWISVTNNKFVLSGFSFTSGLANLLIILIFIIIAFAFIFKIETFQLKKTVPKLIMVALLLNFSLVFIGMALDISNIIYSTILNEMTIKAQEINPNDQYQAQQEGKSLLALTNEKLIGPLWFQVVTMLAWISALTIAFSIPLSAPLAQAGLVIGAQTVFIPNILIWVSQLISAFLLAGVFFLFIFTFIARVYIIKFLAILSPLAFLSLILPQTEKYWKQWLNHFLQWLLLGIFLLFFLVLGLRGVQDIKPPQPIAPITAMIPGLAWFHIKDFLIFYGTLVIYFIIIYGLSKKAVPALAGAIIASTTSWATFAEKRIVKPMAGAMGKQTREAWKKTWAEPGKPGGVKERIQETAKKWAEAPAPKGIVPGTFWALRRGIGKGLAITPREAGMREIENWKKKAEEIKTPEFALSEINGALGFKDNSKALGLLSKTIEKGGGFKKLIEKEVKLEDAISLAQYANRIGAVKEAKRIAGAFALNKENLQKYPDLLKRMGFKEFEDLTPEEQKEWTTKGYKTALDKLVREATPDEIKHFNSKFFESEEVMESVLEWKEPTQVANVAKAAQEFGTYFTRRYMEKTEELIDKIGIEKYVETRPELALYLTTTPAQLTGLYGPRGLTKENIRRIREKTKRRRRIILPGEKETPKRRIIRPEEENEEE